MGMSLAKQLKQSQHFFKQSELLIGFQQIIQLEAKIN